MRCPNRSCLYLRRYGAPAEWPRGTRTCAACGARLADDAPASSDESQSIRLVTIAGFREPHEAHLARGRLETEGVPARVAGEHLASLNPMFADTGGFIRLEVAPADVARAVAILRRDHSETMAEQGGPAPAPAPHPEICPRCGSAAVADERRAGGAIVGALLQAIRGPRSVCLSCGHRWKRRRTG